MSCSHSAVAFEIPKDFCCLSPVSSPSMKGRLWPQKVITPLVIFGLHQSLAGTLVSSPCELMGLWGKCWIAYQLYLIKVQSVAFIRQARIPLSPNTYRCPPKDPPAIVKDLLILLSSFLSFHDPILPCKLLVFNLIFHTYFVPRIIRWVVLWVHDFSNIHEGSPSGMMN